MTGAKVVPDLLSNPVHVSYEDRHVSTVLVAALLACGAGRGGRRASRKMSCRSSRATASPATARVRPSWAWICAPRLRRLKGSHNGPVIVKGTPEESLLWRKVSKRAMPPAIYGQKSRTPISPSSSSWIADGAPSDAADRRVAKTAAEQTRPLRPRAPSDLQGALRRMPRRAETHGRVSACTRWPTVLKGGTNGPVIVEGFSERSLLVRRLANHTMPPPGRGRAARRKRRSAPFASGSIAADFGSPSRWTPRTAPFTTLEAPADHSRAAASSGRSGSPSPRRSRR